MPVEANKAFKKEFEEFTNWVLSYRHPTAKYKNHELLESRRTPIIITLAIPQGAAGSELQKKFNVIKHDVANALNIPSKNALYYGFAEPLTVGWTLCEPCNNIVIKVEGLMHYTHKLLSDRESASFLSKNKVDISELTYRL